MKKKMIGLVLALALVIVTVPALATTVPSKTTDDLNQLTIEDYGVPLAGPFATTNTLSEGAQTEFNAISEYINGGNSAASYFGLDDGSDMVLGEFVSMDLNNYDASYGDVNATLAFATQYQANQPVKVMFGYTDENGNVVWTELDAVAVDGGLQILFPAELLSKAGSDAMLAVLS